jgi:hypothetical protein
MLSVPTFKPCYPIPFAILLKSDNRAPHALSSAISPKLILGHFIITTYAPSRRD